MDASRVASEVIELHRFFQRWFNGTVPRTAESFARVSTVWPPWFTLIDPHNEYHAGPSLLQSTFEQHGRFRDLSIEIKNIKVNCTAGTVAVATYEEWHVEPHEVEARLCSATLVLHPPSSSTLLWVHIHESRLALGNRIMPTIGRSGIA